MYFCCAATVEGIRQSPAKNIADAAQDRPPEKDNFMLLHLTASRSAPSVPETAAAVFQAGLVST
jgi:hypothetical protein